MFDIQINDTLSLDSLSQRLSHNTGLLVHVLPEIDSTNSYILEQAVHLPSEPHSVMACLALRQYKGRGRLGREWVSTNYQSANSYQHTAFIASIGIVTELSVSDLSILSLHVGVAVAQYLQGLGLDIALKWPNDLVLRSQSLNTIEKIGGILVETRSLDRQVSQDKIAVVIGLGLNWYAAPIINGRPTACVADNIPSYALPDSESACTALLCAMNTAWKRTYNKQHCEFAPFDVLFGHKITVQPIISNVLLSDSPLTNSLSTTVSNNSPITGIAYGINSKGYLGIHTELGLRWLHSGEISFNQ